MNRTDNSILNSSLRLVMQVSAVLLVTMLVLLALGSFDIDSASAHLQATSGKTPANTRFSEWLHLDSHVNESSFESPDRTTAVVVGFRDFDDSDLAQVARLPHL